MSRIGKNPVEIPDGVSVDVAGQVVTAKGKQGQLSATLGDDVDIAAHERGFERAAHDIHRITGQPPLAPVARRGDAELIGREGGACEQQDNREEAHGLLRDD